MFLKCVCVCVCVCVCARVCVCVCVLSEITKLILNQRVINYFSTDELLSLCFTCYIL